MSVSSKALVTPDGSGLVIKVVDSTGAPSPVVTVSAGNDVQTISLASTTVSGTFALTLGGQSTTTIPYTVTNPDHYGLWTIPVAPGAGRSSFR